MTQRTLPNGDRPAFPTDRIADGACHANGLTKREWFAGLAMQSLLPSLKEIGMMALVNAADAKKIPGVVTEAAYDLADAMLAEGERRLNERAKARQEVAPNG